MLTVYEAGVMVFAGVVATALVATFREWHLTRRYQLQLDAVHTKLREADTRIKVLEGQVTALLQRSGVSVTAGGDVNLRDAVGRDKSEVG